MLTRLKNGQGFSGFSPLQGKWNAQINAYVLHHIDQPECIRFKGSLLNPQNNQRSDYAFNIKNAHPYPHDFHTKIKLDSRAILSVNYHKQSQILTLSVQDIKKKSVLKSFFESPHFIIENEDTSLAASEVVQGSDLSHQSAQESQKSHSSQGSHQMALEDSQESSLQPSAVKAPHPSPLKPHLASLMDSKTELTVHHQPLPHFGDCKQAMPLLLKQEYHRFSSTLQQRLKNIPFLISAYSEHPNAQQKATEYLLNEAHRLLQNCSSFLEKHNYGSDLQWFDFSTHSSLLTMLKANDCLTKDWINALKLIGIFKQAELDSNHLLHFYFQEEPYLAHFLKSLGFSEHSSIFDSTLLAEKIRTQYRSSQAQEKKLGEPILKVEILYDLCKELDFLNIQALQDIRLQIESQVHQAIQQHWRVFYTSVDAVANQEITANQGTQKVIQDLEKNLWIFQGKIQQFFLLQDAYRDLFMNSIPEFSPQQKQAVISMMIITPAVLAHLNDQKKSELSVFRQTFLKVLKALSYTSGLCTYSYHLQDLVTYFGNPKNAECPWEPNLFIFQELDLENGNKQFFIKAKIKSILAQIQNLNQQFHHLFFHDTALFQDHWIFEDYPLENLGKLSLKGAQTVQRRIQSHCEALYLTLSEQEQQHYLKILDLTQQKLKQQEAQQEITNIDLQRYLQWLKALTPLLIETEVKAKC